MTLAVLTFMFTLSTVLVSYWALVLRPETRMAAQVRARLRVKAAAPAGSLVKRGGFDLSGDAASWYRRRVVGPVAVLMERAGLRLNPARLVIGTALGAVATFCVCLAAQAAAPPALVVAVMTPLVPYFYLRAAANRRMAALEGAFPEAIDLMARALRSGHALTASLGMIAEEMTEPVRSEFRLLYEQQNYGLPVPQVLKAFALRMPLPDVRLFVTAVLTQRDTGGNLAEILDNLASVTRDRFRIRRQLRVLTAQGRMTGWILAMFPLGLACVLWLVNPSHMRAFLADPMGVRMLQIAVVLQIAGTLMIRRIVSVEY